MNPWWLKLFGIRLGDLREGSQLELTFTHAPQSWAWFVLIALAVGAVYAVFYLYRREIDTCPRRIKFFLGVLRALVLLVLALVFLGPAIQVTNHETVKPYLVILIDDSLSITTTRDQYVDDKAIARVAAALQTTPDKLRALNLMPTRAEVMEKIFRRAWPIKSDDGKTIGSMRLTDALARHCDVRVFCFARKLWEDSAPGMAPPSTGSGQAAPGTTPGKSVAPAPGAVTQPSEDLAVLRQGTNIAQAIRSAKQRLQDKPIEAIVVVSDGQINEGERADEMFAAPAPGRANAREPIVPVFAVGIGDQSNPRNVRVTEIACADTTWKGDVLTVRASVQAEGLGKKTIGGKDEFETLHPVLVITPAGEGGGPEDRVEVEPKDKEHHRELTFPDGRGEVNDIVFEYAPPKTGKFIYRVKVEELANVLRKDDAHKEKLVEVVDTKAKVLLVAGTPTWDYQLVRALLARDKTIELTCWQQSLDLDLQQEGSTPIKELPGFSADPNQAPELFKYDVVIMLDPNPAPDYNPNEFSAEWLDLLKKFVGERAGGFMYVAGANYTSTLLTRPQADRLRDLLPVTFDDLGLAEAASLTATYDHLLPIEATSDGLEHPALMFDNDHRRNEDLWHDMPGVYWSFPAKKEKPAAKVLVRLRSGEPLIVAGQFGAGRSIWVGFDSTWRWRRVRPLEGPGKPANPDSPYFDKFWIQTLHYLIDSRRIGGGQRGRIKLDQERVSQGETLHFTAQLLDPALRPLQQKSVTARLRTPHNPQAPIEELETIELHPLIQDPADPAAKGRLGWYEGSITPTDLGHFEILIPLDAEGGVAAKPIHREFDVELPAAETEDIRLDREGLIHVAEKTGGRYFDVDEANLLADPQVLRNKETNPESRPNPTALWDTRNLLIALVALLSIEWAVRKRNKLM